MILKIFLNKIESTLKTFSIEYSSQIEKDIMSNFIQGLINDKIRSISQDSKSINEEKLLIFHENKADYFNVKYQVEYI